MNWLHACYGDRRRRRARADVGRAGARARLGARLSPRRRRAARARGGVRGQLPALAARSPRAARSGRSVPAAARHCARRCALPSARWGSAAFFVYTGIEAGVGAWSYSLLALSRGFAMEVAAFWVSAFWVGLTAGRVVAGAVGPRAPAPRGSCGSRSADCVAGTALVWLAPIRGSELVGLALVGLACGPIFPTLIATTPRRVGAGHAGERRGRADRRGGARPVDPARGAGSPGRRVRARGDRAVPRAGGDRARASIVATGRASERPLSPRRARPRASAAPWRAPCGAGRADCRR